MQTLNEIRRLLDEANLAPRKAFGQCFLIDAHHMAAVLETADPADDAVVLEVGPGTGSLTEELLARCGRVVAVEIDRGLCDLLRRRLGDASRLTLLCCDVLAGKHTLNPRVLDALGPRAEMVANLPYNIATPLVAECLRESWRARLPAGRCRFDRLTFTVQKEVADRLAAGPGDGSYGPVSVLVALLGDARAGAVIPPTAFWPRPKVSSRVVRIDVDPDAADRLRDVEALSAVLTAAFGQRRKQIGSAGRRTDAFEAAAFDAALAAAGIDPTARAERIDPGQYLTLSNALAEAPRKADR